MGGFAFLVLIGIYGVILYWFARNQENGADGTDGIFAIRPRDASQKHKHSSQNKNGAEEKAALSGAEMIKARVLEAKTKAQASNNDD